MRAILGTGFGNGDEIGFWERDLGTGTRLFFGNGIRERDENMASKDIAESPTEERSGAGTP